MSGNVKQFVDFSTNTNNDTGENTSSSIQPYNDGETINQTTLRRPDESLRQRSEAVRNAMGDTLYLRDSDRNLVITGPGRITWPGSTTIAATGIPVLTDTLYVIPMLTPGFAQAAPVPPVASVFGTLHLKRNDLVNAILVTSMRRSYAAGDQINIQVTAGSVFSCTLLASTNYQRTIQIVATASTTLSTVISALNALLPTAPDNTQLVNAALEGGALGTDLILTTQAKQYVSGNYDGEGHALTPANIAAFFTANPTSALAEGDSLCIQYATVTDTASTGGRRQALPENSNTAVPVGSYFNSRVNPEKLVNAIPICKVVNGALVFGTGVEIPAGGTNQSLSVADPGSRILRNGGFEHGVTGDTTRYGVSDWENRPTLAVNGAWRLGTTTPLTGAKTLELNKTSTSATVARIEQQQEIPVNPGQSVRVVASVKQLIAPTAGTYTVVLYWGDANSAASGSTSVALQVLATIDSSYRTIDQTIAVPAGKRILKTVTIEAAGVTAISTGVALLVDDVQVYVETQSAQTPAADNARLRAALVDAVTIEDPSTYSLGQLAALLRFDKSTPVGEGSLIGQRKDGDVQYPPALSWLGRIVNLGSQMLFGSVESALPRVQAPFSSNDQFTLMIEFPPDLPGLKGVRIFMGDLDNVSPTQPGIFITTNAKWDGTQWSKDTNGVASHGLYLCPAVAGGKSQLRLVTQSTPNTWATTAWEISLEHFTASAALQMGKVVGGIEQGSVRAMQFLAGPSYGTYDPNLTSITTDLGYERKANVAEWGNGDVPPISVVDMHGRVFNRAALYEDDFQGITLDAGKWVKQDFSGTGSAALPAGGGNYVDIQTAAASGNHTILRNTGNAYWDTGGAGIGVGFRTRIRATNITNAEQRFGFWDNSTFNPDNDNALNGFKIINGVVSLVWTDSGGLHIVPTGVTVTTSQVRWYSFAWSPVNGILQWNIGPSTGDYLPYGLSSTYGEQPADDVILSGQAYLFAGCKTNAAAASRLFCGHLSAWRWSRF